MAMRIYFVGSHATGKTTLCRYVSRRYGLPMISEVARAVLAEMETALDATWTSWPSTRSACSRGRSW